LVISKLPELKKLDSLLITKVEVDAVLQQKGKSEKKDDKGKLIIEDLMWKKSDPSAKKMINLREKLEHYLKTG